MSEKTCWARSSISFSVSFSAASGAYLRREQLKACSALCTTHLKPLTPKRAETTLCKLVFCALVQNGLEKLKRKSTKKKAKLKNKNYLCRMPSLLELSIDACQDAERHPPVTEPWRSPAPTQQATHPQCIHKVVGQHALACKSLLCCLKYLCRRKQDAAATTRHAKPGQAEPRWRQQWGRRGTLLLLALVYTLSGCDFLSDGCKSLA